MKNPKQPNIFSYVGLTKEDFMNKLNKQYPIELIHNEDLINRIHSRYPYLDKSKIVLIVNATFSSLRDFLVLGKVLNLNKLFFDTKLFFYSRKLKEKVLHLKVKASTPPRMRFP